MWGDTRQPVEVAETLADCGVPVACERFQHPAPCGPRRDPGPRDDWGARWHWCYRITVGRHVFIAGRRDEALNILDGVSFGYEAAFMPGSLKGRGELLRQY